MINNKYWLTKLIIPHVNLKLNVYRHAVSYAFNHNCLDIIRLLYLYGCKFISFNNNYYTMNCKSKNCKCIQTPIYSQPI